MKHRIPVLAVLGLLGLVPACDVDTLTEPSFEPDVPPAAFDHVPTHGDAWVANGPGTVSVTSDGTFLDPSMEYALHGSAVYSAQRWTFSSLATETGWVTLDYDYQGFHAWYQVRVSLEAFITRGGNTTYVPLVSAGPANCCGGPPSGGFQYTGSYEFDLQAGDVFGFRFGGQNGDSDARLLGTFTVAYPPEPVVFTSGSHVMTWDPIVPSSMPGDWTTSVCTTQPAVGLDDPRWTNPHSAFVMGHPWAADYFEAPWINAWSHNQSYGSGGPYPYHNWTKYTTEVSGNGDFVVQLLADNCSWIYLDDTLIGVQGTNLAANTYPVALSGSHQLTFIIYDGGGAAGGKFRLETFDSYIEEGEDPGDILPPPTVVDTDGDGVPDDQDAFPNDPTETADTDGDGYGDNGDAFPNDPTEWADTDGDGYGDNGDAFPNDPTEWADTDGDGYGDNGDAFPNDPTEWADTDGDGYGDNGDAFPNDPTEWADTDGDGYGDNGDAFPNSDLSSTVALGTCDAGVSNQLMGDGSTFMDLIGLAKAESGGNHGQFVRTVTQLAGEWMKASLISGRENGAITSCAARDNDASNENRGRGRGL